MSAAMAIVLVIVNVPFVAGFFGTAPLVPADLAFVLAAAVIFLAIRESGLLLSGRRRGVRAR